MKLEVNVGSDRSWMWTCHADFAEEKPTEELFAIRFANSESMYNDGELRDYKRFTRKPIDAQKFKEKFEEAQKTVSADASVTTTTVETKKEEEEEKKTEEEQPQATKEEEKKE